MNIKALESLAALEEQADSILIGPSTGRTGRFVATRQQLKAVAAVAAAMAAAEAKCAPSAVAAARPVRRPVERPEIMTIVSQSVKQRGPITVPEIKQELVDAMSKQMENGAVAGVRLVKITGQPNSKADKRKTLKRESAR